MKIKTLIMAVSLAVNVIDTATPALTALEGVLNERQLGAAVGEAEVNLFQQHFLNNGENKYGWPTTSFWPRAAKATNWQLTGSFGLSININQIGVRQRYQGGDIFPTEGHQYLTIPAREEAYGHLAGEFSNLKVAFSRGHAFALVEADATQITYGKKNRKTGQRDFSADTVGGGVYYWLVQSVHQQPDETVIPNERDIAQVAREAIGEVIDRVGGES